MGLLGIILTIFATLFILLFTIYFFNLDMKLVACVYTLLGKRFDSMEKETKL